MRAVARVTDFTLPVDQDDATGAFKPFVKQRDNPLRGRSRFAAGFEISDSALGEQQPDKSFAVAGAGGGAELVGIGAAAYKRRVADPPWELVEHTASGSRGREFAKRVEGNAADSAVLAFPVAPFALNDQRIRRALWKTDLPGK